ncbi:TPA: hypothetical protein ACGO2X_001336 [Streptococcus suis]
MEIIEKILRQLLKNESEIDVWEQLPKPSDEGFSVDITEKFALCLDTVQIDCEDGETVDKILTNYLFGEIDNADDSELDRFLTLFFMLKVYHRRRKNVAKIQELVDKCRSRLANLPHFIFVDSWLFKEKHQLQDLKKALRKAGFGIKRARELYKKVDPWLYNHYATVLITFSEDGFRSAISKNDFEQAMENMRAVEEHTIYCDYPTFKVTIGRLLSINRQYDEAKHYILAARNQEQNSSRLAEYNDYLVRIDTEKLLYDLENREQEIEARIDQNQTTMLEFLGFFAGIISFIVATISIESQSLSYSVTLILTMLGALLIAFSSFFVLVSRAARKDWKFSLLVILIGIMVILLAILVTPQLLG